MSAPRNAKAEMTIGQVAILAPRWRYASVIRRLLEHWGLPTVICADVGTLLAAISNGADVAVVTEEALDGPNLDAVVDWVDRQPPWSDFPFILIAARRAGPHPTDRSAILARLRAAVLLERPLSNQTLVSAVLAALRARFRQYQLREHLAASETGAEALRDLNATLEQRIEERTRDLRDANAALRDSETQFRGYFDNFPECLFVVDVGDDGRFRLNSYNPAAERTTGLRTEDVRGLAPEAFMPETAAAAVTAAFHECVSRGAVYNFVHVATPPSRVATFETVLTPLRDQAGRIVRLLGASRDVTERNRLEAQVRQSQKLEALGQLTGGIAHDFNNLLQVVTGGLALLERAKDDPKRYGELMEAIRRAAQRGGDLTKRLLTLARRESLHTEAVELSKWLDDGARDLLARTLRGDVTVESLVAPDLPPVKVDPAELEVAVLNLAVNARDAMPRGGTLTLMAQEVELEESDYELGLRGPFVRLSVSDVGHGMTPDVQARAFEPFFTTKGVGRGTGLGLAQVYGFVRQSGGAVHLQSTIGKGTTISLFLPCSRQSMPVRVRNNTSGADPPVGGVVLVVEDDDDVAALVTDMLSQLGYASTRVTNAAAALEALADGRKVDLMFTDIMMPGGMNGLALAAEVARRRPDVTVLLTTGYSGTVASRLDPTQVVLRKPYRIEDLAQALARTLGHCATQV